jgi:hypothetical protein
MDSQLAALEEEIDLLDIEPDEERRVREWRIEQLLHLGLPRALAHGVADAVDWHDIAALVKRGCAPKLALEIVR